MKYDLIVLGAGPGGYQGAIAAAKKGKKIAVLEKDKLGGTCLQRGCIPTKTIISSVKVIKTLREAQKFGVKIKDYEIDVGEISARSSRVVNKLTKGIEHLFKKNNIDLFLEEGRVISEKQVLLADGTKLEADHILLATGSSIAELPEIKIDHQLILGSDDLLQLKEIPESMLVVGAGAVGLEWALIYSFLGCKVTVVEILNQIVAGSDSEVARMMKNELQKNGLEVFTATTIKKLELKKDEVLATLQSDEKEWQQSFKRVLLAVGRVPNSSAIFADGFTLSKDKKGFLMVNQNLQTSSPSIFACGDLVGAPLLAHKASHQALEAVDFIFEKKPIQTHHYPAAIFTFPELATIGLTEDQARQEFGSILVSKFTYAASSRANASEEKSGLVKLIASKDHTLLGAHILGSEAAELLPLLTFAINEKLKAENFKNLIFIHPTLSENLWEALGMIGNFAIHL